MVENEYFSAVARIQKDRGQNVVSSGPYRVVRHPSYAGALLASLAQPFMLSTLWALIPAGATAAALVVRTYLEDRMLRRELAGYQGYAERTRYRLIPGVW
jgi:protein-S-isoprenylcysteine O-methyltransferase Ste14